MPGRTPKPPRDAAPPDPATLRRVAAGHYATGDGRFSAEQSSGGWMLIDAEQTDELGLPLVRGAYPTLDAARLALAAMRSGPAPVSDLGARIQAIRRSGSDRSTTRSRGGNPPQAAPPREPEPEPPPPIVIREFRSRDGAALRTLWEAAGFSSLGDDDVGLRRFAQRNPGLFVVASQGSEVVGSAMGGWDGRRGWIYHVTTSVAHRRGGLASRLVGQVESGLRALGCPKVNVIVREGNEEAAAFWRAVAYQAHDGHLFAHELPIPVADGEGAGDG